MNEVMQIAIEQQELAMACMLRVYYQVNRNDSSMVEHFNIGYPIEGAHDIHTWRRLHAIGKRRIRKFQTGDILELAGFCRRHQRIDCEVCLRQLHSSV